MNSVRFGEELCANVMPAFEQMLYDGWLLRFAGGSAHNNNSVWPLYTGELPLAEKITFCERQYIARQFPCCFRLAEIPGHDAIAALLADRGYVEANPNLVLVNPSVDGPAPEITELAWDDWLETAFRIDPVDNPHLKAWQGQVFSRGVLPQRFAVVLRQGEACAYGYSIRQGSILWLNDLWVQPDLRGQGIGTHLIQGLLRRGREDGAHIGCLAVNESNVGARRLYERFGFVQRYRYS